MKAALPQTIRSKELTFSVAVFENLHSPYNGSDNLLRKK